MFGKDLQIKKYPYMSYSQNMMEYFAIIGYQESFIPIIIDSFKNKKSSYSPTILSSITSNIDFGIVDNELIISQVYPDNPTIYPIFKNENSILEPPQSNNMIYSFCFDSADGKSKLFYTCFAYRFYEKYIHLNNSAIEEYYIPKAFCIVSQYSFFSLFDYICRHIYSLTTRKNSIPVELIIYNIVNFIPSPMNYNLQLDLFGFYFNSKPVEINQLSGYPYIDFDLKEVFNILPINLFLEIYLLTIIEQSLLFFSSNLEILNIIMYIMYILNYPCNDSTYFWHIVSVSKNNLVEDNKFVGKIMVSLLGVNSSYDESIDTFAFGPYHYIVDIDNKKLIYKESLDISKDEKEDSKNLNILHGYIKDIIKEKNVESSFLKTFITKLKKNLESTINKGQENNSSASKVKTVKFFKMSKSIYDTNKKIQEIFYDFCLNILTIFYQDNSLENSFDKVRKVEFSLEEQNKRINNLKLNDTNIDITLEEKYFMDFFRGAIKYKIYFENFLQNLDIIDVFKISLLLSDEFINIKIKDPKNKILSKLSLFSIIDSLYYPQKRQTINITVSNLFMISKDKIDDFFEQDINIGNYNNGIKRYNTSQLIDLNKKIINKYLFLLNNFYEKEEIRDIFPSIRILEEQPVISFDRRYIINIIINNFENNNLISTTNYLIYASIYIFCISMSLYSYIKMLKHFERLINSLGKIKFFLRHFGYIILQTFYKYHLIQEEKNTYPEMGIPQIKMYIYMLMTFLKQNNIIPNEEMITLLTKFFENLNSKEIKPIQEKGGKAIDSEADFEIIRNNNFFCFMKYCFDNKKYFSSNTMIKSALKEQSNCNIIITKSKKRLNPTIVIKIKEYIYTTEFFSPKKIYKLSELCFNDFNENHNLNMSKLKIKKVRDCIANLIQYGLEIKELLPTSYLIYTLYLFRNFEEKYLKNNIENSEIKYDSIIYKEMKNEINEDENKNKNINDSNLISVINDSKNEENNKKEEEEKENKNEINEKEENKNNIIKDEKENKKDEVNNNKDNIIKIDEENKKEEINFDEQNGKDIIYDDKILSRNSTNIKIDEENKNENNNIKESEENIIYEIKNEIVSENKINENINENEKENKTENNNNKINEVEIEVKNDNNNNIKNNEDNDNINKNIDNNNINQNKDNTENIDIINDINNIKNNEENKNHIINNDEKNKDDINGDKKEEEIKKDINDINDNENNEEKNDINNEIKGE